MGMGIGMKGVWDRSMGSGIEAGEHSFLLASHDAFFFPLLLIYSCTYLLTYISTVLLLYGTVIYWKFKDAITATVLKGRRLLSLGGTAAS